LALRVALVGAGGIGGYHLDQIRKYVGQKPGSVEVVGVSDVVRERAEELAKKAGCQAFTDHIEMYDRVRPDAVFIGIPPFAHTDQETGAAERGIHVFVQKPPALTMEKAREVEAVLARHGVISAVGFQDRYLDVVAEAKQALAGEKVALAMGYWIGGLPGAPWWRVRAQSGGQAVEQTIHIFDTARYLFGEAESVEAMATSGLMVDVPNYDVDDASAMTIKFKNGVICTIFSACYLRGAPGKAGLDVYGQTARVEYALRSRCRISRRGEVREVEHRNDNDLECVGTFLDAVQARDPSKIRSPYSDAVKSLELPLAGHRSIETGRVVALS
jgi:myo-inositol 2-dehydrogenase/D-chiro-inositol 1-dehydrogenase